MVNQRLKQQFGNYRLLHLLGQGGFSEVYLGEHVYLKTQAAIKILKMRLEQNEFQHFLREARIIAHLEHPHIIQVLDFGLERGRNVGEPFESQPASQPDELRSTLRVRQTARNALRPYIPFLVLTYAPNGSMRQRFPRGTALPMANIVSYTKELASALQYAHSQKLIHGDVKPENILIGRSEALLLSDFGVAVVSQHFPDTIQRVPTRQNEISGTVAYMAPEQLGGKPCPASDQYGLGVVVYEWLSGSRPFTGSFREIAMQHLSAAPPSLCEKVPTLSPAIEKAVMKVLAKDPQQRFASVEDFAKAFEEASEAQPESTNGIIEVRSGTEEQAFHSVQEKVYPQAIPAQTIWDVPYARNPHFTGREDILERIHALLQSGRESTQFPLAISGLGGMGKTQTLIEYAYRYWGEYAAVLWAKADTYETLFADFMAIAHELHLVDNSEKDAQHILNAMKHWLTAHSNWLLMLDNIEDFSLLSRFVPANSRGHLLLTTRSSATGTYAQRIELEKLTLEEGALFLLKRSKILMPGSDREQAEDADLVEAGDICKLLDGLPLALDQAGAYIEETGCTLYQYIALFRKQRGTLLNRRGEYSSLHPESVTATVSLALEQVAQFSLAALELLKLCAFLYADGISEEILVGDSWMIARVGKDTSTVREVPGDDDTLDMLIAALRKYSLVYRNADNRTLRIHALIQAVVKDNMGRDEQGQWAERAVQVINRAFPQGDLVATWRQCEQCLPHVYTCLAHLEQWHLVLPEAARLFDEAGRYLLEQGHYVQANYFLKKALDLHAALNVTEDSDQVETLNNLASCYVSQGEYGQAEALFSRVLSIVERERGAVHEDVAVTLNNLALLSYEQGIYASTEQYLQRALRIWEALEEVREVGAIGHADHARTCNSLALLYHKQGKLDDAELYYMRGLAIWERLSGPTHPDLAIHLNNLATLYCQQGRYARAEPLFARVLEIREKTLGPEHPIVAHSLIYLARLYLRQWRYAEAELLLRQALAIRKRALGPEHPEIAHSLCNLARLYALQDKYTQAEPLYKQALAIREAALGPEHPDVATLLKNYAILLMSMKRKDEAVQLAMRAKAIRATILLRNGGA